MTRGATSRMLYITSKECLPEAHREHYERIADSRGKVSGPFAVLMNSPDVAGRIGHLGAFVRFESGLSDTDRELAILTTAREFDCPYEWAFHEPLAREVGVPSTVIDVVASGIPANDLGMPEILIIRYSRELLRNDRVPDSLFDDVKTYLGPQAITDLTVTIGYYAMLACVLNAFEVLPVELEEDPW